MPRAHRISCHGFVWHITHRCHRSAFLLKFVRDRRRWRHWLFEARRRYGLSVLNYIATSNHVHLLCADQGRGEISRSLQLAAGRTAQEFNFRKTRKGAFWEDRYHATAVQSGEHLMRCMTYIDLNMVRAGVVGHPRDWEVSGYNEIQDPWQRKSVIDFDALCSYVNTDAKVGLPSLMNKQLCEEIERTERQSKWTESVAVGDEEYLHAIKESLGSRGIHRNIAGAKKVEEVRDSDCAYIPLLHSKWHD